MHMELTRQNLLDFITTEMERDKCTVHGLERKAGVTQDSIRDFLRGTVSIPRPDKLQKMLAALGYDLIIVKREP